MKLKKKARKEIREAMKYIQHLPVDQNVITYLQLYQCLQALYFQRKYRQVIDISKALRR